MALRMGALHDALLHPGDVELAKKASEEVAAYDNRLAELSSDVKLLKWMMTLVIGLLLSLVAKAFL